MCGCSPTATSPPRPTAARSAVAAAPTSRSPCRRTLCWPLSSPRQPPTPAPCGPPTAGSADHSTGTPRPHADRTGRASRRPGGFVSFRDAADSAAQGGLLLHMRQLLGIAHGVQPGDEAVVDAYRYDGVDLAVEAEDQRRVAVDLRRLQRGRGGDPAQPGR